MESLVKEMVGIIMVMLGVEIVAAQRVKQAAEEAKLSREDKNA